MPNVRSPKVHEGRLLDAQTHRLVVERTLRTSNIWERMGGLLVRPRLRDNEGLLIAPCASVHTCFMTYEVDLVFLTRDGRIGKVVSRLKPWRMATFWGATMTLELIGGLAANLGLVVSQQLVWEEKK